MGVLITTIFVATLLAVTFARKALASEIIHWQCEKCGARATTTEGNVPQAQDCQCGEKCVWKRMN